MNYSRALPRDTGGAPMQAYPAPYPAVAVTHKQTCASSSILYLNPNTTAVEVAAWGGQGIAIRWVPSVEGAGAAPFGSVIASTIAANFDHIIPTATVRRFVVPRATVGQAVGQAASIYGLYSKMAFIAAGTTAASILVTEF